MAKLSKIRQILTDLSIAVTQGLPQLLAGDRALLQRRLTIGYSRASRLIDQMRAMGIVGAYKGSQASDVTMSLEEWDNFQASQNQEKLSPADQDTADPPHSES